MARLTACLVTVLLEGRHEGSNLHGGAKLRSAGAKEVMRGILEVLEALAIAVVGFKVDGVQVGGEDVRQSQSSWKRRIRCEML